ncbi:MAG: glycosyltransferase [Firmicutes bacterium]|nr:glycosyltransferase [Bacillota bacterium]
MDEPLVSVIIPTYKSTITLKDAIDSVLNQVYKNIEIIVIDDNNPNTQERVSTELIINEYRNNDNVNYIQHEKNKNGAAARNTGFNNSNGQYICFLDDDDLFCPDKVKEQVEYLTAHNEYQAVYCGRYQWNKVITSNKKGDLSEEILSLSFTPYTSSIMLRRECYIALNGFDENYKRHQDFEFLLRFFELYSIGVIEKPLIKIKGNQINNALHGSELEALKDKFLNQFMSHINRIDREKKGFKKMVLAKHYSALFWNCVKRVRLIIALRVFIKYTQICGFIFWKCIYFHFKNWVESKMEISNA